MPGNQKRAAIVLHNVKDQPWGTMVKKSIESALKDYPDITAEFADPEGDINLQIRLLEEYLNDGVDALVVLPIDPAMIQPVLRKYRDAHIPMIGLGYDLSEPDLYRTLIGADNRQFGRAVCEFFIEIMDGRGDIVEICGAQSTAATGDRSAGFRERLASTPGMRVLDQCAGDWSYDRARQEFSRMLERHARIDGVFSHSDEMARGAWDAAAAVGREREMLITGIDAVRGERGIQMVVQGRLAATFINPSPGKAAVDALVVTLGGGVCLPKRLLHTYPFKSNACIRAWQEDRRRS